MKKLMVIALCLFSMFVVCTTTVHASNCGKENISVKEMKQCEPITGDDDGKIFGRLTFLSYVLFFITSMLFIRGMVLIKQKKKKVIAILLCLTPIIPSCLFFIVKMFESLM